MVICKPEPKGGRAVTKIRTFEQAEKDLDELKTLLGTEATPQVDTACGPTASTSSSLRRRPPVERDLRAPRGLAARRRAARRPGRLGRQLRRGEAAMLKTAFRRCHNYIHGNEGMPKDAAFWQFLYLMFAKMHDER